MKGMTCHLWQLEQSHHTTPHHNKIHLVKHCSASQNDKSHHLASHHTTSYHIILHHIISHHIMSYHVKSHDIISHYTKLHHTTVQYRVTFFIKYSIAFHNNQSLSLPAVAPKTHFRTSPYQLYSGGTFAAFCTVTRIVCNQVAIELYSSFLVL
jgi:hypothetical protein